MAPQTGHDQKGERMRYQGKGSCRVLGAGGRRIEEAIQIGAHSRHGNAQCSGKSSGTIRSDPSMPSLDQAKHTPRNFCISADLGAGETTGFDMFGQIHG